MDINDIRSLITVAGFGLFLALVAHVWRAKAKPLHDSASRLVFEGEHSSDSHPAEGHARG